MNKRKPVDEKLLCTNHLHLLIQLPKLNISPYDRGTWSSRRDGPHIVGKGHQAARCRVHMGVSGDGISPCTEQLLREDRALALSQPGHSTQHGVTRGGA